jgi:glycosyltransferase involved in cell wall biosynthesis
VSVVIATFNWSSVLRYALASALGQTYPELEVIVVGDGCTDDSADVVAAAGDERVRWHNLPSNSGSQSIPNNAGIELARGDYVAYLGHDDIWHPHHLAHAVHALQARSADAAYCAVEVVGPEGSGFRDVLGCFAPGPTWNGMPLAPSGLVHRRGMVDDAGPWRDYRTISQAPDNEFMARAFEAGQRFVPAHALTVFKFNSAHRRGSYILRRSDEQARYLHRIHHERGFVHRELAALAVVLLRSTVRPTTGRLPQLPPAPDPLPPGWQVTQFRRIRGLEP